MTRKEYHVEPFNTGLISGSLDPARFAATLNKFGQEGWRFLRSVHETRRILGIFKREAHFLVFERES